MQASLALTTRAQLLQSRLVQVSGLIFKAMQHLGVNESRLEETRERLESGRKYCL